jgi:nicotinamidase-related amidase
VWGLQRLDHSLFDRQKSCLIVIDVQQCFLDKLPLDWRQPLVARIAWLMRLASHLDIPIIATAEDMGNDGPLVTPVMIELKPNAVVHDKMVFGLCGQSSILDDVRRSGRDEFVIVGLETDVCVAHSALGLVDQGFRVAVIEDGTASPPPHHEHGIRRLAAAGVVVNSLKGIYYEWLRDLATAKSVRQQMCGPLPPGLTL